MTDPTSREHDEGLPPQVQRAIRHNRRVLFVAYAAVVGLAILALVRCAG